MDDSKLKVFISYSRADYAFADELVEGLEYDGRFEVSIDRHSIIEGEDWKARLGALIADADTVIFILSPEFAQSEICSWEVERAHELSKRILPVLWRPLGSISAPTRLATLNYVRFDEKRPFIKGLKALVTSLNTNVDWLREHTRLLARAREWEAKHSENRLLSGADISAAKEWLAARPKDSPEPTELHLKFIKMSEAADIARSDTELRRQAQLAELKATAELQAEKDRSRRQLYAVTGSALVILLMFFGWQWFKAKQISKPIEEAFQKGTAAFCKEALIVTDVLGTTNDLVVWDDNLRSFRSLYQGMKQFESLKSDFSIKTVETAMDSFADTLYQNMENPYNARESDLPRADLTNLAEGVATACSDFSDGS